MQKYKVILCPSISCFLIYKLLTLLISYLLNLFNVLFVDSDNTTPVAPIPEYTASEEHQDNKDWRVVEISEKSYRVDMKAIDPYKKVLSHGGKVHIQGSYFSGRLVFLLSM